MTKNEICLALATKLEPRPAYKPKDRIEGVAVDIDGQLSRLGFWVYSISQGWIPVDFFTSAEGQWKLLEAMPPMLLAKCRLRSPDEPIQWDIQIGGNHSLHDDRATAIILAACKWQHIEVNNAED